jgi:hypothetical protein
MTINDNDGLYIGSNKRRNRYWLMQDDEGNYGDLIPDSIHPDELLDDSNQHSKEIRSFASACLVNCNLVVIGCDPKKQRILGARFLHCKSPTPAVVRHAARMAVQCGWRTATLAVKQDLDQDCIDAAHITGDVCLIKFDLLVAREEI